MIRLPGATPLQAHIHALFEKDIVLLKQRVAKSYSEYLAAFNAEGARGLKTRVCIRQNTQLKNRLARVEEFHKEFLASLKR